MISDEEKSKLIAFGQHIEKDIQFQTKQMFQYRPSLPGFGEIEGDEFIRYDLGVTFSLSHLMKVAENNPGSNMAQQVGLIFASEIIMSLFYKVLMIFDVNINVINAPSAQSIVNFAKYHKESTILCSPEDLWEFQSLDDYEDENLMDFCGPNEPYQVGKIGRTSVVNNPTQLIHDKSIILLTKPLIEYGVAVNRETITTYDVKDDDIEVIYNPVDVYYRLAADLDSFKTFNINAED